VSKYCNISLVGIKNQSYFWFAKGRTGAISKSLTSIMIVYLKQKWLIVCANQMQCQCGSSSKWLLPHESISPTIFSNTNRRKRNVIVTKDVVLFHQHFLLLSKLQHCFLTWVNFITEDRMPRYTYLYENRMFTYKVSAALIGGGKGKRLKLIKLKELN